MQQKHQPKRLQRLGNLIYSTTNDPQYPNCNVQYFTDEKSVQYGPSGKVYNVMIRVTNSDKDLKILKDSVVKIVKWEAENQKAYKSLQPETQTVRLVYHQNCVRVTSSFVNNQNFNCFVMKKAQTSLEHKIKERQIPQIKIMDYLRQIVNGLSYLHQQYAKQSNLQFIHRNLKPSNILIYQTVNSQILKISDLQMSKIVDKAKMRSHTIVGTMRYTSPQVLFNSSQIPYTQKCDIWSLGIICLKMLGYNAFDKAISSGSLMVKAQKKIKEQVQLGLLKIKQKRDLSGSMKFWQKLLQKILEYDQSKRWGIKQLRQYIEEHYQKILEIIEERQESSKPIILMSQVKKQFQQYQNCWYDVHKFESTLIKNILLIQEKFDQIKCKKIHIYVLIFLSLYEYHHSFEQGIKAKKYPSHYLKQLHRENLEVINFNQRQQLIQSLLIVEDLIEDQTNKVILKIFPQFKDINQIIQQTKYETLIRKYIQVFQQEMTICPIAKSYLILFKMVGLKRQLIILPNKMNPIIKDYQSIFKKIQKMVKIQVQNFYHPESIFNQKLKNQQKKLQELQCLQEKFNKILHKF